MTNHGMWSAQDWQLLAASAARCRQISIKQLLENDPARADNFAKRIGPFYINFARQQFDEPALHAMFDQLKNAGFDQQRQALFAGQKINSSEQRAVLHTALRSQQVTNEAARSAHQIAEQALVKAEAIALQLRADGITDVISVGIGGSDLGPRLLLNALEDNADRAIRIHFLSSADGVFLERLMQSVNPDTCALLLVSKSFSTQETLLNGSQLQTWMNNPKRVFAVTANPERAMQQRILEENILPIWDWLGGRFSVWSCVAFASMLGLGMPNFREFLRGAAEMDAHFLHANYEDNAVIWHALSAIWNRNGLGYGTQAIIPYDQRLDLLPAHLQQVVMESLGKTINSQNLACEMATGPVLMGANGNMGQHSFFQYLHQGSDIVPVDFIGVLKPNHSKARNHQFTLANMLAHAQSLANGHIGEDLQKCYPGNRPSSMILLDELTPYSLGLLLAFYEHSVFVQASIWGINAFDQWGVELGKQIANQILPLVENPGKGNDHQDAVTRALLATINA